MARNPGLADSLNGDANQTRPLFRALYILERVMVIRQRDGTVAYRIWMDPETRKIQDGCPWLKKDSESNRHLCLIHDVRPAICRQYPGSRKHARMTGCPGFDAQTRKPRFAR